jgi:hypothetical protein
MNRGLRPPLKGGFMQVEYNNGDISKWEDYNAEGLARHLEDSNVKRVIVEKMTPEQRAAWNRKIESRRKRNKAARKARSKHGR